LCESELPPTSSSSWLKPVLPSISMYSKNQVLSPKSVYHSYHIFKSH
jgi:hypothetical protein